MRRLTAPVPHSSIAQRDAQAEQTRALGSARAEIATLRERLETIGEELESDRTRLAGELRHAQRTATDAVRDRDEANAARRKERDSREIALQTIEQALVARDKARRAAESALAERDNAVARLEEALGQRDRAVARRDRAAAERDQAAAERDQAAKELERVTDKRGELARANEQLRHQHETAVPSRGAVPMMRNAAVDSSTERRQVQRLAAAIPIASLLVVALAVILILSSH